MSEQISFNVRMSYDPSKAEEIALVNKLYKNFKRTNTYLSGMFSMGLVSWAEERIRNDWSLDVIDELVDAEVRAGNAEGELRVLKADHAKEIERKDAEIEHITGKMEQRIDELNFHLSEANNAAERHLRKAQELGQELALEKQVTANSEKLVQSLKWEITELKAKLYDQENGNGEG
jgi:chromosome segregation ATPase